VKIGIDASCWANRRGYGRYTREIITAILEVDTRNEYVLFLDAPTEQQCPDLPRHVRRHVVHTTAAATAAASSDGRRSLRDLWAMARAVSASRSSLDVFYFPSVYTFFPVPRRLRTLVTIHDTIAERHPALVFPHRHHQLFWTLKVAWAVRQAARILTVSNTAKSDVMARFGLPADRVAVVSNAVGSEFRPPDDPAGTQRILARHGLTPANRFLLYVGGMSPHKNIETLIDAYCAIGGEDGFGDLRLVLIGEVERDAFHSSYQALRQRVARGGATGKVIFTGFVPDEELRYWFAAAQALVLPSVDEGFGLPAIEAMACGTPVVASRAGALPEVVADAGLLFEPRSAAALANVLRRVLADAPLRDALTVKGRGRAAQFTWRASARSAIVQFEDVGTRR